MRPFVISFTMGTTNRLDSMNEDAFAYSSLHTTTQMPYRMDDEARRVFLDATKLGFYLATVRSSRHGRLRAVSSI